MFYFSIDEDGTVFNTENRLGSKVTDSLLVKSCDIAVRAESYDQALAMINTEYIDAGLSVREKEAWSRDRIMRE